MNVRNDIGCHGPGTAQATLRGYVTAAMPGSLRQPQPNGTNESGELT